MKLRSNATVTQTSACCGGAVAALRCCRLPPGHARRAALRGVRGELDVRGQPRIADRADRHGARGWLRDDEALYTGKIAGQPVDEFPFPIGRAELQRGQERFNIYCTPCHGRLGDGNGMVVQRGLRQAASYHQDRLRQEKLGYFYDVITNGFGAMQGYAEQIPVRDRWLIVAYVRTLQLSQHASVNDVPADQRGALDAARRAGAPATAGGGQRTAQAGGETLVSTATATSETYTASGTPLPGMRQFGMIAGVLGVVLAVAGFFMSGARSLLPGVSGRLHVLDGRGARQHGAADGAAPVGRRLGHRAAPAVRSGGAHAAVHGGVVPADRVRDALALHWSHADAVANDPIIADEVALPEHAVLPRAPGVLLHRLGRPWATC